MATSKPTLTELRAEVAELKAAYATQSELMQGLIRDNERLTTFAQKAAPVLNTLVNSQNKPSLQQNQPTPQRQAAPQRTAAIKHVPPRPQQTQNAEAPALAVYDQYKTAVRARAMETNTSITLLPFSKASTMTLEQLMGTIR